MRATGKLIGFVSAVNDGISLINKYQTGTVTSADYIKFGISLGAVFMRTNLYAAIGYGLMDITGYNPIDMILGKKDK